MTNRLLVNPGTPQAWEIQLKSGTNRLGRGDDNDFQINHPSVSGTHCEIIVSSAGVMLKDLDSTNGTYVNRARVQEALLQSGQHMQLGMVDMLFESSSPAAPAPRTVSATASPPPIPPPVPVRVTLTAPPAAGTSRVSEVEPEAEVAAEAPPPPPPVPASGAFCKSHAKTPARFFCGHCQAYFCDLCVNTRPGGGGPARFCRKCGNACAPVQMSASRAGGERGFYGQLPAAFLYPFKGSGVLVLLVATVVFTALKFVSTGIFGILLQIAVLGYLFSYLQTIIHATAAEEKEIPGLPGGEDVFGAFFQLLGSILMSFGPLIALGAARLLFDVPVPGPALMAAVLFGCLYFPMAFLAVAMKDSVLAANPLIVLPAILKVPGEYLLTVVLLALVFGFRSLGDLTMDTLFAASLTSKSMSTFLLMAAARGFWAFVSLYLLTVMMRILGLLYLTRKHKLAWFSH